MTADVPGTSPEVTKPMKDIRQQRALMGTTARWYMVMPFAFCVPAAYATLFERGIDSPAFQSVLELAPGPVWGALYVITAMLALTTARWGTVWSYRATNILMVTLSWTTGGSVFLAKVLSDLNVSWLALGGWGFIANVSLFVTIIPYEVGRPPTPES